ncbi:fibronectin type III domain-containing protein [Flavobacterium sp. RHBU_24]|uniref:Ig-like domain-containing protein n=1 Tax=Flavobacterium sp. RHBU_24 TaxID=3391185 RepID=UPI0039846964
MRKITLLIAAMLASMGSYAQTAIQYGFNAGTGTYAELASPTVLGSSTTTGGATSLDDVEYQVAFPSGFTFSYLGNAQTAVNVDTNGYVGFSTAAWTGYTYGPLGNNPSGGTTAGIISAFGADLNAYANTTTAPGSLSWAVEGTGNDLVLVIQYKNFKPYEFSDTVDRLLNFQIRLYASTHTAKANYIELVYGNNVIGDAASTGVDVGIRGAGTGWAANVNSVMLDNVPTGTSCNWLNAVSANNNSNGNYFNSANAAINIPNGLVYTFYPQNAAGPSPVRTFAATTFTTTTATISWTAASNATQYNVQYRIPGSCTWTDWTGNPVNGTSVTLTGLTELTPYQVRVQASIGTVNAVWSHIPNTGGGGNGYSAAGTFTTLASCIEPTALVAGPVTTTTASYTFTASVTTPASGYDYYLSTSSTAPTGSTTPTGNVAGTGINLSALTPNTVYYLWVRSNCGNGTSVWTSSVTFATLCEPTPLTYNQGFNATTIPSCWTKQNVAVQTTSYINFITAGTNPTSTPQEGSGFVRYNSYSASAGAEERLISPPLASTGVSSVDVEFYWFQLNGSSYNSGSYLNEGVNVQYSIDGGVTWVAAGEFIPRHVATAPGAGEWSRKTVTLPAAAANQANLLVALKFHSEFGYNMFVDNFTVKATPDCANPSALTLVSAGENDLNISWTASVSAPANGYQYYVSTTATPPTSGTVATGSVPAGTLTAAIGSLTPSTGYYIWVRSRCDTNLYSEWAGPLMAGTLCDAGDVVTTTPGTACGQGTVALAATANTDAVLSWYTAPTGGASVATGTTYTTPLITQTTTYYVSSGNVSANNTAVVGAGASSSESGGISPYYHGWGGVKTQYIITAAELQAAGVFAGPINSVGFTITSLGTATLNSFALSIGTTTQNVATSTHIDGLVPVYSNAAQTLTTGLNNYVFSSPFVWNGTSNIVVQVCFSNVNFGGTSSAVQYDNPGYVSATYTYADNQAASAICPTLTGAVNGSGGTTTNNGRAKMTFNATTICNSARVPVVATITAAPAITATAADTVLCAGETTQLSVTSNNADYTYVWMPGNLTGPVQSVTPAQTTMYTVTATDGVSGCVTTATVNITVNDLPNAITITPAAQAICSGTVQSLAVTGSQASGTAAIGNGTTAPSATSYPNPLSAYYGGTKTQILFKAAELQAQGLIVGSSINTIAFDMFASAANALIDLRIKIGSTAVADLTSGFVNSASLTTVYNANYTPTAGATGWVPITLTTPYIWTGGDIIVEVAHNAGNFGNGSGTRTRTTTTSYNSVYTGAIDAVTPAGVASLDAIAAGGYSVNSASVLRPNVAFSYSYANTVTFSPVAGLYTDAAATVPYAGTNLTTVYAKPLETTTYIATATNIAGCTRTATSVITVTTIPAPTGAASQTLCYGAPISDITAVGEELQYYTTATGGTALSPTTTANFGFYYVSQTVGGCESPARLAVAVSINLVAAPVIADEEVTFCNEGTVADLTATGTGIEWYAAATGGEPLAADTAFTEGTTVYYASQTVDGCESPARAGVAVTLNVTAAPEADAMQTFCNTASVADLSAEGTDVMWYATETGGNALTEDTVLTNDVTYYAEQTVEGCTSAVRTPVMAMITVTPAPEAAAEQTFCNQGIVASLDAEGNNVMWYASETGGEALAGDVALEDGMMYYASQSVEGCESMMRTPVTVTITTVMADSLEDVTSCYQYTLPALQNGAYYTEPGGMGEMLEAGYIISGSATVYIYASQGDCSDETSFDITISTTPAPEAQSPQIVTAESAVATIEDIFVAANGAVTWYASAGDAANGTNPLEAGTAIEAGATYYATQTIDGCTSQDIVAVTISEILGGKSFDASAFTYYPNPVKDVLHLEYSSEITSVAVYNLLGQVVLAKQPNATTAQLDMAPLSEGTYMVIVTAGDAVQTIKVVKRQN